MTHRHVRTVYNCRKHQKEICKNVKLGVQIYLNLYLVKSMPYYVCVDSLPKAQLFSSFFPLSLDKESVYNPKAVWLRPNPPSKFDARNAKKWDLIDLCDGNDPLVIILPFLTIFPYIFNNLGNMFYFVDCASSVFVPEDRTYSALVQSSSRLFIFISKESSAYSYIFLCKQNNTLMQQ